MRLEVLETLADNFVDDLEQRVHWPALSILENARVGHSDGVGVLLGPHGLV